MAKKRAAGRPLELSCPIQAVTELLPRSLQPFFVSMAFRFGTVRRTFWAPGNGMTKLGKPWPAVTGLQSCSHPTRLSPSGSRESFFTS
jgi:hypothetical protein